MGAVYLQLALNTGSLFYYNMVSNLILKSLCKNLVCLNFLTENLG